MLSGLGTLLGAGAVVFAALVGRKAVEDFRQQKIAEREIEYAEKLLTLAYRLQDAISVIRSPMTLGGELAESEKALDESKALEGLSPGERDRLIQGNVFYLRTNAYEGLFKDAYEIMPFAKAYFGKRAAEKFAEILKVRHSVRVYANAYAKDQGRDPKFTRKIESVVWEGADPEKGDEIVAMIEANIAVLEERVMPKLRPEAQLKGMAK